MKGGFQLFLESPTFCPTHTCTQNNKDEHTLLNKISLYIMPWPDLGQVVSRANKILDCLHTYFSVLLLSALIAMLFEPPS